MREIKFRAIHRLTKKKWINEELVFHNGAWYEDWRAFEDGTPLNMSQCAVMQYTGLKDKYSTEIYEGDILVVGETENVTKVIFNKGCFYTPMDTGNYRLGGWQQNAIVIVGNIYENPELLEEKQ